MTAIKSEAQRDLQDVCGSKEKSRKHFTLKINPAYEQYNFNKMKQQEGQSFTTFLQQ